MGLLDRFKKDEAKIKKEKDKKLTSDNMRIRIFRLVNGTPAELGVFLASLKRDANNNSVIFNNEKNFKEKVPGVHDKIVSDILYKLENRSSSKDEQLKAVKEAIIKQENLLKNEKEGYLKEGKDSIKVNIKSEESRLRLLKCVKYTLDNKGGEGYFECVESDGYRSLSYVLIDGNLFPYWYRLPESEGEPVVLVPDVVQKKVFYKEAGDEAIGDFNDSQDNKMFKGVLGFLTKALFLIMFIVLVWGTVHNLGVATDYYDEDLSVKLQTLEVENERIKQACNAQYIHQMDTNEILIDYAKKVINGSVSSDNAKVDKSNIKI